MKTKREFSRAGLQALFDYIGQIESETGEQIELDVIALCCDYTEYQSIEDFRRDYGDAYETIEDIERVTTVIPVDDSAFIIPSAF